MKKLKNLALLLSALSLLSLFGCQNPSNGSLPESAIPAEIEVENNTITFVQVPDAKSIPEGITEYRVNFYTEDGYDYKWLAVHYVNSTKNFEDINIDEIIWDKTLNNNVFKMYFRTAEVPIVK